MALLPPEGEPIDRASWTVDIVDDSCEVVVSRSPDRESVAVLVGPELRTIDLRDGALSEPVVVAPLDRVALAADPLLDRGRDDPAIVWDENTIPAAIRPGLTRALSLSLEPGWTLSLVGAAVVDGGHSGHMCSGSGVFAADGESVHELWAALHERQAKTLGEEERFRCATVRRGRETLVHEEAGLHRDGTTKLHWPPVVGPAGALLRRSRVTRVFDDPERGSGLVEDTEMGAPWLVTRDGEVRTIPVELGVSPLCELPDGRYLLPGNDALWRDGTDEELHVLDADGRVEPLLVEGAPVDPSRILGKLAPQLLPTPEQREDETVCDPRAARIDPVSGDLIVLLAELPWETDARRDPSGPWAVVAVPLAPARSWRLLAIGDRRPGTHVAVAL